MDYGYSYQPQPPAYQVPAFPPTPTQTFDQHEGPAHEYQELFHPATYPGIDPTQYQFAADAFSAPEEHQHYEQQHQAPPTSQHPHSQSLSEHTPPLSEPIPTNVAVPSIEPGSVPPQTANGDVDGTDYGSAEQNGHRSSSEDKETMTQAQSRRKAQNRAAQRAFRERKERHVKDLESRLNSLSAHSTTVLTENERLKRELQRLETQNEILRATSGGYPNGYPNGHANGESARTPSPVPGPQSYTPTDFQNAVGVDPQKHPLSFEDFGGGAGQRQLAAGATWDLIQGHELFRRGQLDIADVCRRLKGKAACNGRGPVFKEAEVLRAIDESAIAGSDELI